MNDCRLKMVVKEQTPFSCARCTLYFGREGVVQLKNNAILCQHKSHHLPHQLIDSWNLSAFAEEIRFKSSLALLMTTGQSINVLYQDS